MIACGVNEVNLFNVNTTSQRIVAGLLDEILATCMDNSFEDLDQYFKTYSNFTQIQGQIRLMSGTERNMKAVIQCTQDERIVVRNHLTVNFPITNDPTLLIYFTSLIFSS